MPDDTHAACPHAFLWADLRGVRLPFLRLRHDGLSQGCLGSIDGSNMEIESLVTSDVIWSVSNSVRVGVFGLL